MKIKIKLHPGSSQEKIEEAPRTPAGTEYEVWIKEKPIDGKANIYLEKFLRKYFGKKVKIISGFKSKNKMLEIK